MMNMNRAQLIIPGIAVMAMLLLSQVAAAAFLPQQVGIPGPVCKAHLIMLTPMTNVTVGQMLSGGPVSVRLEDLTYPNANNVSDGIFNAYYGGTEVASNATIAPYSFKNLYTVKQGQMFTTSYGVKTNNIIPGLYAYNRIAQMQLYEVIVVCRPPP